MTDFYTDRDTPGWLADVTHDMISAGQVKTNEWNTFWASGINQTYNNQRTQASGANGDQDIQVNFSWPAMMQQAAIQAQRRPVIHVEPHDEQMLDQAASEFWEGVLQHQYINDLGMPVLNQCASIDAFIYGIYIAKVFWEPRAEWDMKNRKWIGKPQTTLICPPYFGAHPEAEAIDGNTPYVYSGRRVEVDWAIQRFARGDEEIRQAILKAAEEDPYNTEYARAMSLGEETSFAPVGLGSSESALTSGVQVDTGKDLVDTTSRGRLASLIRKSRGYLTANDTNNYTGRPKRVTLWEVYFRDLSEEQRKDTETVPIEELEDNGSIYKAEDETWRVGNPEAFRDKNPELKEGDIFLARHTPTVTNKDMEPKFPRGRFVVKVGRDTILNPKEENQVYPYRLWPYMTGVLHRLPHMWQGLNGTEMSENLQTMINTSYTAMLNSVKWHGNSILMVDRSAIEDGQEVVNAPGGVLGVKSGKLGSAAAFVETATITQAIPTSIAAMERQIQGQTGTSDEATAKSSPGAPPTATQVATQAQQDIIRSGLQIQMRDEWNTKIMQLVAEMDQANLEPGQMMKMSGKEFNERTAELTQDLIELEFAIKLEIGTGLPFDAEKKKQDWERLAGLFGAMPIAKQILEAFDVPNADEVLANMDDYQQFLAFQEQLQAQQEEQAKQEAAGTAAQPGMSSQTSM